MISGKDAEVDVRGELVAAQLADVLARRFSRVDARASSRPHAFPFRRSRRSRGRGSRRLRVSRNLPRLLGRVFGLLSRICSRAVAAVSRFQSG